MPENNNLYNHVYPELKPCPFCGGKAYASFNGLHVFYYVRCEQCSLNVERSSARRPAFETKEEAIAFWNTRIEDPRSPNEVFVENRKLTDTINKVKEVISLDSEDMRALVYRIAYDGASAATIYTWFFRKLRPILGIETLNMFDPNENIPHE